MSERTRLKQQSKGEKGETEDGGGMREGGRSVTQKEGGAWAEMEGGQGV